LRFSEIHFVLQIGMKIVLFLKTDTRFLSSSNAIYVLLLYFVLFKYFELYDTLHTARSLFSFM